MLRELYLRPFEDLVKAGVLAVMASYNRQGGTSLTDHWALTRDVLQQEWGFDGVVVSDWFATRSVVPAARSGLDLAMPGPVSPWTEGLVAAVEAGEVDEAEVDEKVLRLLRLASRVGALDGASDPLPEPVAPSRQELRTLTGRGMTLLRNETVLPLGANQTVAVIGEFATSLPRRAAAAPTSSPSTSHSPSTRCRLGARGSSTSRSGGGARPRRPAAGPDHGPGDRRAGRPPRTPRR